MRTTWEQLGTCFQLLLIISTSCVNNVTACGGCSTCDEIDAACVPTQVRTRSKAYSNGWWWNKRTGYYATYEYYKGTPYCCAGYQLTGLTCTSTSRNCGGCDNDGVSSQIPCLAETQQKQLKTAIVTFSCTGWWFVVKTCYRQTSYYQLHRFIVPSCCVGYTLKSGTCTKDAAPDTCGVSKYSTPGVLKTPFIVGGSTARPNEFPWQLRLTLSTTGMCGAVLVASEWALTAAHCVMRYTSTPIQVGILAGDHNYKFIENTEQRSFAKTIFVHPDYSTQTFANDLAVVRLASPVTFNAEVQPICLPESCDEVYVEQTVYIQGWGRASAGPRDTPIVRYDELQFTTLVVKDNSFCSSFVAMDTFLCASDNQNDRVRSPCFGDSGGPMALRGSDGRFKVIGIASFVAARGCAEGLPSGFTDLRPYLKWIKQIIY